MFSPTICLWAIDVSSLPLAAIALLVAGAVYVAFVYLFHPLSRVPPIHWSAPVSSSYTLYLLYSHSRRVCLYDAHTGRQELSESHPVVRVGPNEVSIMTNEGIRLVYGGGFERSSWYELFDNFGYVGLGVLDGSN